MILNRWNDGLPEDRLEELQVMNLEKQVGVTSDETRQKEYLNKRGMKDDQIQEEITKVKEDKANVTGPTTTAPVVSLPPKTEQPAK